MIVSFLRFFTARFARDTEFAEIYFFLLFLERRKSKNQSALRKMSSLGEVVELFLIDILSAQQFKVYG